VLPYAPQIEGPKRKVAGRIFSEGANVQVVKIRPLTFHHPVTISSKC
jgi:hypothetical protein